MMILQFMFFGGLVGKLSSNNNYVEQWSVSERDKEGERLFARVPIYRGIP